MNGSAARKSLPADAELSAQGHLLPWRRIRHEQVQGLLDLAGQLQEVLVPVEPNTDYRRRLHGELVLRAQRRQAEPPRSILQQHKKGILIGAAAVGSLASIAGVVIAFVVRHRHQEASNVAG
jgi:hypothetical protein